MLITAGCAFVSCTEDAQSAKKKSHAVCSCLLISGAVEDAVSKAGETMQDTSPAGEFWEAPKVH